MEGSMFYQVKIFQQEAKVKNEHSGKKYKNIIYFH